MRVWGLGFRVLGCFFQGLRVEDLEFRLGTAPTHKQFIMRVTFRAIYIYIHTTKCTCYPTLTGGQYPRYRFQGIVIQEQGVG